METIGNRLLVIDDEPLLRDSIVAYLEDSEFDVLSAASGSEGLELFHNEYPDLILCDLRMPVMDGLTLLEKVRETHPHTPFIVVSGAGVMTDVVKALQLGASDYITKPIHDMERLEHAVRKNLKQAQLERENQKYRSHLEAVNQKLTEKMEIFKADLEAGRQVQKRMLPEEHLTLNNYHFDHYIHPSLYLSGDFCDYFKISSHEVVFYIADVSGHGASSAFVTVLLNNLFSRLRRNLKRGSSDELKSPERVMERINKEIIDAGLGKHLTLFIGLIDTENHHLTYSTGAQLPRPLYWNGTHCQFLNGDGSAIGLFNNAQFQTNQLDLTESFQLTLFSDGVLEILPQENIAAKEEYLRELMEDPSTQEGVLALSEKLNLADDKETPDDVAILRITRN